jgi:hypothetical protein
MAKKSVQKAAKNKADHLFSLIVRSKGFCENCGGNSFVQTAHWLSRRYSNIRTDFDNAFCLCASCHRFFTADPTAWTDWAISQRGRATYDRLREAANRQSSVDWPAQVEILKALAEQEGLL